MCVCSLGTILGDQEEWEGMYHWLRDIGLSMTILECSSVVHLLPIMVLLHIYQSRFWELYYYKLSCSVCIAEREDKKTYLPSELKDYYSFPTISLENGSAEG